MKHRGRLASVRSDCPRILFRQFAVATIAAAILPLASFAETEGQAILGRDAQEHSRVLLCSEFSELHEDWLERALESVSGEDITISSRASEWRKDGAKDGIVVVLINPDSPKRAPCVETLTSTNEELAEALGDVLTAFSEDGLPYLPKYIRQGQAISHAALGGYGGQRFYVYGSRVEPTERANWFIESFYDLDHEFCCDRSACQPQ